MCATAPDSEISTMSVARARELLGPEAEGLTDSQILAIIQAIDTLADITLDLAESQLKAKRGSCT